MLLLIDGYMNCIGYMDAYDNSNINEISVSHRIHVHFNSNTSCNLCIRINAGARASAKASANNIMISKYCLSSAQNYKVTNDTVHKLLFVMTIISLKTN